MKLTLEPVLTGLALTAIVANVLVQGLVVHEPFKIALNLAAYLTGGWFRVGAAIIQQCLEGAILLFRFSFSNTPQTYALGRSRNASVP